MDFEVIIINKKVLVRSGSSLHGILLFCRISDGATRTDGRVLFVS